VVHALVFGLKDLRQKVSFLEAVLGVKTDISREGKDETSRGNGRHGEWKREAR